MYFGFVWWQKEGRIFELFALKVGSFNTGVHVEDKSDVAIVVASCVRLKWLGDILL